MPGFRNTGWELTDFSSMAATVDVGAAVGGGRFTLEIKDSQNTKRKLNYGGISAGVGVGPNFSNMSRATNAAQAAARAAEDVELAVIGRGMRPVLNFILPLFRGGMNSLSLPSRQSAIYLNDGFSSQSSQLSWNSDFIGKSMLLISISSGAGFAISGTIIFFFPQRFNFSGSFSPLLALRESRAVAFAAGMQIGQLGAELIFTPCMQFG